MMKKTYLHRSGRVGRMGEKGTSVDAIRRM